MLSHPKSEETHHTADASLLSDHAINGCADAASQGFFFFWVFFSHTWNNNSSPKQTRWQAPFSIFFIKFLSGYRGRVKWKRVGNNLRKKVHPGVWEGRALHFGDILTDLAEQRRYENKPRFWQCALAQLILEISAASVSPLNKAIMAYIKWES